MPLFLQRYKNLLLFYRLSIVFVIFARYTLSTLFVRRYGSTIKKKQKPDIWKQ